MRASYWGRHPMGGPLTPLFSAGDWQWPVNAMIRQLLGLRPDTCQCQDSVLPPRFLLHHFSDLQFRNVVPTEIIGQCHSHIWVEWDAFAKRAICFAQIFQTLFTTKHMYALHHSSITGSCPFLLLKFEPWCLLHLRAHCFPSPLHA